MIQLDDSSDLRTFMQTLKDWAESNHEKAVLMRIEEAERRGMSASELLIEYSSALRDLKTQFINRLPENFQKLLDRAVLIAEDAVNLGSYTYRAK